jgi:4-hydroxybenzoate polyprenyltransferase
MIWILTAVTLLLWLGGILLGLGQWVNLFLVAAAVMLVYQAIEEREARARKD